MTAPQHDLPDDLRKQIDEALAQGQADRLPREPARRPPSRSSPHLPDIRPRAPKDLLLVSLLVALAGWMFPFPFHAQLVVAGLAGAGIALLSMLLRPQGRHQQYWRGRPVQLPAHSWTERLYRLLYRG